MEDVGFTVATTGGVTRLTLTRPETRNSLSHALCGALHAAIGAAAADPECRVFLLEGSGGAFASGADVAELQRLRADRPRLLAAYRQLRATQELLYGLPKPTIARIDGYCMGAGLSLAIACDLRLATPRSTFAASPSRIGLIYSDREVWRLALRIGMAGARDLLFTGRRISGTEALHLGLIDRLSEPADAETDCRRLLDELAAGSQHSVRKTKGQLLRMERALQAGTGADESEAEESFFEPDAAEGFLAFLERRAPRFP